MVLRPGSQRHEQPGSLLPCGQMMASQHGLASGTRAEASTCILLAGLHTGVLHSVSRRGFCHKV